jgi:transposase
MATPATGVSGVGHGLPLLPKLEERGGVDVYSEGIYERVRTQAGRTLCPSVVIMDSQSVKTTERGGARGFDGHKRIKGRKRHILVDTLGVPIACRVEPANLSDRRGAERIVGCARYMLYPKTACFDSLRVSRSALAKDFQWACRLRQTVEADLQLASDRNLLYVEIGGWALSEEWRQTKAALETAIGSYALGNLWGGAIGSCTATARHGSASILRRLGGSSFETRGEPLPVYFDAQYGCNMELLRFDSRHPVSRFEPLIKELTRKLEKTQVITSSAHSPCPSSTLSRDHGYDQPGFAAERIQAIDFHHSS